MIDVDKLKALAESSLTYHEHCPGCYDEETVVDTRIGRRHLDRNGGARTCAKIDLGERVIRVRALAQAALDFATLWRVLETWLNANDWHHPSSPDHKEKCRLYRVDCALAQAGLAIRDRRAPSHRLDMLARNLEVVGALCRAFDLGVHWADVIADPERYDNEHPWSPYDGKATPDA